MKLPTLNEIAMQRSVIDVFGGYNHNMRISDSEFYDMKNLTSTYYPVLSPRGKRGTYKEVTSPSGMIAKDALCYVDGSEFVMNEYRVEMGLNDEPKQLVSMGAYVVIMPDKKYINTKDLTDFGNIEADVSTQSAVTFSLCKLDGTDYSNENITTTEPNEPENLALWIDTSTVPHSLKQWSKSSNMWTTIATTYIKISSPGIGAAFQKYDGINISGLKDKVLHDSTTGNVLENTDDLAALEGTAIVWEKSDDYIVIVGMLDITRTISDSITIIRKMPIMDFVIESGNRLWGCRYGTDANGETVNEIYASKLGDFKNWNCYMGLSTDSYVASVGTDGIFTGAITHLGYPLFFKENYVHKVYGNYPANFSIQTTACRGVQKDCSKSLAIVNETLYYKARSGICAYDGSLPVEVSSAFGDAVYSGAVAVAHGNKYYVSMKDTDDHGNIFVYDTHKGIWHKEDDIEVKEFCSCRNEIYYIPQNENKIKTVFGTGVVDKERVKWMAETGAIGISAPDKKYVSRLNIRMSLDVGTKIYFYAQYDSCGEWHLLSSMTGTSLRSFSVPVRPKRCDHFRLRIIGEGDAKIYSIVKTLEQGSDL